jgi:AraC-like DNA-binding protein
MSERRSVVPVPTALDPWVTEISLSTYEDEPQTRTEAPDPAVTVAVRWFGEDSGDVVVAGPRSRAIHYTAEPGPACLQLRMRPGWVPPAFGPVRETVNQVIPLGHDADALLSLVTVDNGQDLVRTELLESATRLLAQGANVRSVAHTLRISERHMRSLFTRMIGLSPKQFARINRVRIVATSIGHGDLAELAAIAGYYDQAHMTTEFRRLMGITPGAFAAGQRPRPSPCHHRPQTATLGGTPNSSRHRHSE